MQLKPRTKPSGYEGADADFALLQSKQENYFNYFLKDNPLWPVQKYHEERGRITKDWLNITPDQATWTKDIELQELDVALNEIKTNEILDRVIISSIFRKLYSYYEKLVLDFEIGYLSDEAFAGYLFKYDEAIETNKKLKLNCWKKSPVDQIEKMILRIARTLIK